MTQVDTAETGQLSRAADDEGTRPAGGSRPGPWKRGPVLTACALLLGLLLPLHGKLTDWAGLGSLVETFLPWFGLCVPVLLAAALRRRSASAVVVLLLPAVAWLHLFGGLPPLAVYVTHLGSVRVMPRGGFWTDSRDAGATKLAQAVAAEPRERVLVLGDFNGTMDDRAFNGLTSQLRSVQDVAGISW